MFELWLLIVSGPPASGKTTVSRRLAQRLGWPLISKDGLKETLFDSLGWDDLEWSAKLSGASYDLLYYFVEAQLSARKSFIIEANFQPEPHTHKLALLKQKYDFKICQLQCRTEGQVLLDRYRARWESGQRHPGHLEHWQFERQKEVLLKGRLEPLALDGPLLEVDTTDFEQLDYPALYQTVEAALEFQPL